MPLQLPCSLNLSSDNIFCDDVSVDSFSGEQDKPSLIIHKWQFVLQIILIWEIVMQPVLSLTNVQYKKLGLLNSNQVSQIEYSDNYNTTPTVFSTGNAHTKKIYTVVTWLKLQTLNLKVISEKGEEIVLPTLFQIRI